MMLLYSNKYPKSYPLWTRLRLAVVVWKWTPGHFEKLRFVTQFFFEILACKDTFSFLSISKRKVKVKNIFN